MILKFIQSSLSDIQGKHNNFFLFLYRQLLLTVVPLKLSWTPKQIALLTVVPRSHCGPKTVISNVVFARVSLQPIITCGSTRVAGAFSPKKNNVIPDNDRLSTCYFFSVLQRPVPRFFLSRYLIIALRCSLHRHRCSTALCCHRC